MATRRIDIGGPDRVDLHVGARIRRRRRMRGLTQHAVADRLGLSFQAIQKYENGRNRVSAASLWRLAGVLDVEVGYFFEGLSEGAAVAPPSGEERAALRIVKPLMTLAPDAREAIIGFVRALAPFDDGG